MICPMCGIEMSFVRLNHGNYDWGKICPSCGYMERMGETYDPDKTYKNKKNIKKE